MNNQAEMTSTLLLLSFVSVAVVACTTADETEAEEDVDQIESELVSPSPVLVQGACVPFSSLGPGQAAGVATSHDELLMTPRERSSEGVISMSLSQLSPEQRAAIDKLQKNPCNAQPAWHCVSGIHPNGAPWAICTEGDKVCGVGGPDGYPVGWCH